MKVLVTGAGGQLGYDCVVELKARGLGVLGTGVRERFVAKSERIADCDFPYVAMDVTDPGAVERVFESFQPDAVAHCAAWTAVDLAEDEENRTLVDRVNRLGALHVARAAKRVGAKMVYVSTDYVFDGSGTRPWRPDGERYAPLNVYGRSKLEGELAARGVLRESFVVRASWLFGLNGNNFVKTMINLGKTRDFVRVVDDQIGAPTYTRDLARLLVDMLETEKYGFYHATNEGDYVSWRDFCREIYRLKGLETTILPVSTAEYRGAKATRPLNSRLDTKKLAESGFAPLPDWRDALRRFLHEL